MWSMWFFYLKVSEIHWVRQRTVLVHRIQERLINSLLERQGWHMELPDTWRLLTPPHPPPLHLSTSRAPFFFSPCPFATRGPYLTPLSSYQQRESDLPQFQSEQFQGRNLMGQLGCRTDLFWPWRWVMERTEQLLVRLGEDEVSEKNQNGQRK